MGLPQLTANDLLHEAIVRILEGKRHLPRSIEPSTALYFAMRSIANHVRKRMEDGPIDNAIEVFNDYDDIDDEYDVSNAIIPISHSSPEKIAQDREQIVEIERLFHRDIEVKKLLHIWAQGIMGNNAMLELGVSWKRFEAVSKRLHRALAAYKKDTD